MCAKTKLFYIICLPLYGVIVMLDRIRRYIFLHQFATAEKELAQLEQNDPELIAYLEQEKYVYESFNSSEHVPKPPKFVPIAPQPEYVFLEAFKVLSMKPLRSELMEMAEEIFSNFYNENPEKFIELLWLIPQRNTLYSFLGTVFETLAKFDAENAAHIFSTFIQYGKAHHYKNNYYGLIERSFFRNANKIIPQELDQAFEACMNFRYPNVSSFMKYKTVENLYGKNEYLGEGKYAKVYSVLDKNNEMKVIKYFEPKEGYSLLGEVMALSVLNEGGGYPNIIKLEAFNLQFFMMIMPYEIKSISLHDYIKDETKNPELSIKNRFMIAQQLINGLAYMHSRGIAHCDVSLKNMLMIENNNQIQTKWIDFGAAQLIGPPFLPRVCRTTYSYAPPELLFEDDDEDAQKDFIVFNKEKLKGKYDLNSLKEGLDHGPEADVWSWAMAMNFLFKWQVPKKCSIVQMRKNYVYDNVDPREDIPPQTPSCVKKVLLNAFVFNPKERESSEKIAQQLGQVLHIS